ncbi:MAG: LysR family transcriptional regulator, partial [Pseudomonadota bacterium]
MTPPLAALRTFELVARTLSFKRAAAELGLSPTAVSHQIRKLEDALGEAVFERRVRQVELTPKGRELAEAVAPAFETIQQAVEKFTRPGRRAMVTLAAGPLFTSRWLVPRLDAFWTAFPDIDLRLQHSPLPVYRQLTDVDLAIAWGDGDWTGMQADLLLRVEVSPVLSPDLVPEALPLRKPADVLQLPLLHQRSTAPWREWLGAAGVEAAGA